MRSNIIDFRSDTVTQPTPEMLEAMMDAKVGDDVFEDDPSINQLENIAASMFDKEAALFCPSGTMTNQIAIKVHTNAPAEVICSKLAHIYRYEGGGIAFNSGISTRLIGDDRGMFTANDVANEINPDDIHFPPTQLVAIENTCNKGGGSIWDFEEVKKISALCKENNLAFHLDGARLFNALVEGTYSSNEIGREFDSISICLSKGLGAPVGSLLLGNKSFIKKSRRIRKILGGGMRQAGFLAAAGIYALNNNVNRLKKDNERAKQLSDILSNSSNIASVNPVETNIVLYKLKDSIDMSVYINNLKEKGILVSSMGKQIIRLVTHLHHSDVEIERVSKEL